ncbi:hypothetical protein acdb102_22550 [Acidothermaceae bacterium B102]|nr:hypothetical protein acdb102_22550 [Acidothermaceae bacterium B102]
MSSGLEIDIGGASLSISLGGVSFSGPRTADPLSGSYFSLSLDQQDIGSFTEISGIGATLDTEEFVEGGENGFVHRFPKALKWTNIVLKRGFTDSDALLSWMMECAGPGIENQQSSGYQIPLRTATIMAYAPGGVPVRGWRLDSALPVKWTGPSLAANSKAAATEQLEVSHCGLSPAT